MITELTQEQIAKLPEFVQYGIELAMNTTRTNRDEAEQAIIAHYHACGLDTPKIQWYDSPHAFPKALNTVRDTVRNTALNTARNTVQNTVGNTVWHTVWDTVQNTVGNTVWHTVQNTVWHTVWDTVWDTVGACRDADYVAYVKALQYIGVKFPEKVDIFVKMTELCWCAIPTNDIVYVSDRPIAIHITDGQLHNTVGLALEFADGKGYAAIRGQLIPNEWVQGKLPTAAEALKWRNMDQRAAACELIGWINILNQLNSQTIDKDNDPMWCELVSVQLPGARVRDKFLICQCGTGRQFALPVPRECESVDQAQSMLYGDIPASILRNCVIRT